MNGKAFICSIFSIILCISSCDKRPAAYNYIATPQDGWERGDTLRFTVDSLGHAGRYTLSLGLRTSVSLPYPYRSLWVVVKQHWHNPEIITTDTIECTLSDENGDYNGNGVTLYETVLPIKTIDLPKDSHAEITIHHIMRRELLPGITALGLKLE